MRIVTWNMQGAGYSQEQKWQTGVANLERSLDLDAICLQECGSAPSSAIFLADLDVTGPDGYVYEAVLYRMGTERTARFLLIFNWDDGGKRCNVAIITKSEPVDCKAIWAKAKPQWRPALGVPLDNRWVYSFHAISPGGPDAKGILEEVKRKTPSRTSWVVAGDFNREPESLHLPKGSSVCRPNNFTYSVKSPKDRKDYCVWSKVDGVQGEVIKSIVMSDHYPVAYSLP